MDITPFIMQPNSFQLLIAPPASGKTSFLLAQNPAIPWIFVAPFRALAEEFYERLKTEGFSAKILRKRKDPVFDKFANHPRGILVATPETLPTQLPKTIRETCYMVLDEFHLNFTWGNDFRPILMEQFYAWATQGISMLALSATISQSQLEEMKFWSVSQFDHVTILDYGNMSFKYPPKAHIAYSSKRASMRRRVVYESTRGSRCLVFCHSRDDVFYWCEWFRSRNVKTLGCVGGQVMQFCEELKKDQPQLIVTTSALSHGVNLPSFDHVFIFGKPDEAMFLQMAARGGRKGEAFLLHSEQKSSLKMKIKREIFDLYLKFNLYWQQ